MDIVNLKYKQCVTAQEVILFNPKDKSEMCVRACMHASTCVPMCAHMFVHVCACVYMCACMFVLTCKRAFLRACGNV